MVETFVETETCRTKCRWVAKIFREFNRPRATLRSLFYHALLRAESDYPICGGFVGEIRVTRPFEESDGEKLKKWAKLAVELGYIPHDALLEEVAGVQVLIPEFEAAPHLELWLNRSLLNPLIWPVCRKHGITLVSIGGTQFEDALADLLRRVGDGYAVVLCMTDLSPAALSFARDLEEAVSARNKMIKVKHIALTPEQVVRMKVPMVRSEIRKAEHKAYMDMLRRAGLDGRMIAELDAIEVIHPGGIAGFLEELISEHVDGERFS